MTRIPRNPLCGILTTAMKCAALLGLILSASTARAADVDISRVQAGAAKGKIDQEIKLGDAYFTGRGIAQDMKMAAHWYQKAAEAGDPVAENQIGYFYQAGLGVRRDPERAVHWFQLAAANGLVRAKMNLGVAYVWGMGVPKNPEFAAQLFREAATKGEGAAACYLGDMNYLGLGIKQDKASGERWYQAGVALHDPRSAYVLGTLLSVTEDHPHDFAKAATLLRESAASGYVVAMHQLGLLLVNNPVLAKSPAETLSLLDQAEKAGMWRSSAVLGTLARDGKWVPSDNESAYSHFKIAALQGGSAGEQIVHNDLLVLSSKLGREQVAALDAAANDWVQKHSPLQFIFKNGEKWQHFPIYALTVPEVGAHAGALIPGPISDESRQAEISTP